MSKLVIRFYIACAFILAAATLAEASVTSPPLDAVKIYERLSPSLCMLLALDSFGNQIATGSGFVISSEGEIATNAHVIQNSHTVVADCNSVKGKVLKITAFQENLDLVVLKTDIKNVPSLKIAQKSKIKPGAVVFALGNPYGLQASITTGLISGIRSFEDSEYIQISADINPGNSGGPIALSTGEIIGVATLSLRDAQGVNFAIPAELIETLPRVDFDLSTLNKITQTTARPARVKAQLSDLSFRGIPLGTECSELEKFPDRLEWRDGRFISEAAINNNGSNYYLFDILNGTALCEFSCMLGKIYKGSYIDISEHIRGTIFKSLKKKYGLYTAEGKYNYIWDMGEGKEIIYSKANSGRQLIYADRNLEKFLQKQLDLLLYSQLIEEDAI